MNQETNDASRVSRTLPGNRRVSARRGRAGEKIDFLSILLGTRNQTQGSRDSEAVG